MSEPTCKRLSPLQELIPPRCKTCDERIIGYVHVVEREFYCATCCKVHSGVNKLIEGLKT